MIQLLNIFLVKFYLLVENRYHNDSNYIAEVQYINKQEWLELLRVLVSDVDDQNNIHLESYQIVIIITIIIII